MARKTNPPTNKPVKASQALTELPTALSAHAQAIYDLGTNIRNSQYAIAYHLYSISTDCSEELESAGFDDVFDFAKRVFNFEKNYVYKYINVWSHFGLVNADSNDATSLFITDGKDFNISNLIELNQFDKAQVDALIRAKMISVDSTQKQIREIRKAVKDGAIEFYKRGKTICARYIKPKTSEVQQSTSESVDTSVQSDNSVSVDRTDNNIADSDSLVSKPITIDDVNDLGNSIFTDFADFMNANATTYKDVDLYTALVRAETVMASLVMMDSFRINHTKIQERVISVGSALDAIRRMLVNDSNKDGE